MNILLNDLVASRSGASYATFYLRIENTIRHEGKGDRILIGSLPIHRIPVNRASIQSGRGAGFQATHNKTQP
ncbi:hypothetical protein L901_07390 [Agrobacterium sp. D14]|nr:hypothetical protein L901_07390 [Agrobacterium sp. D14]